MKKNLFILTLLLFHLRCFGQIPGLKFEWKCSYQIQSDQKEFWHLATGEDNSVIIQLGDWNMLNDRYPVLWIDKNGTLIAEFDNLPLASTVPGELNDVLYVSSTRFVATFDDNSYSETPPGYLYSAIVTPENIIREFIEKTGVPRQRFGTLNPPTGGVVVYNNGFIFYSISDTYDIPEPEPPAESNPKPLQNVKITVIKGKHEVGDSVYDYEVSITGKGTPWKVFKVIPKFTMNSTTQSDATDFGFVVYPDGHFEWKMWSNYIGKSRYFILQEQP